MSTAYVLVTTLTMPTSQPTPLPQTPLGDHDRQRAESFRTVADRARFVAGRTLLRHGLRTLYGLDRFDLRTGSHGKPMLTDRTHNIDVSLARGGNSIVCGLVRDAMIGVDLEPIDRSWNVMEVADAQFAPVEVAALSRLDEGKCRETFFRLWTIKEAIVKATGLGLTMPLNSFGVTLDPLRLQVGNDDTGDPALWHLAAKRWGNVSMAVAVRGNIPNDIIFADVPLSVL